MSILGDLLSIGEAVLQVQKFQYEKQKDMHLTGAQIEANQFAHDEAQLSYERELQADSTKYQRQVADLQAAGLNPMLAVGQSAGAVHSSPASPSTPAQSNLSGISLGSLLNYKLQQKQLSIQQQLVNAEIRNKDADTASKKTSTAGTELDNEFKRITMESRREAQELSNSLTRSKVREVEKAMDQMDASINLLKEQSDTESTKRQLNLAQSMLAQANAYQIAELLPYQKVYQSAASENQRQAALLAAAHAAYQNKLLSDGYIDAFISAAQSEAGIKINEKEVSDVRTALRIGEPKGAWTDTPGTRFALQHILTPLVTVLDNFNPISNILK